MVELQKTIYALLKEIVQGSFFVRVSKNEDAFWICDIPRRMDHDVCEKAKRALNHMDILVSLDEKAEIWNLDLSDKRLQEMLDGWQGAVPNLPMAEELQEVYALYCLLMAHPVPLHHQPKEDIRCIVKAYFHSPKQFVSTVKLIHARCACRLRKQAALPSGLAGMLAYYVRNEIGVDSDRA